ncbi:MAG: DEAD/DEAH box helicase [Thermoanaerobaculia bacterium]
MREIVESLREDQTFGPQLVEGLFLERTKVRHGKLDPALPLELEAALASRGVPELWRHQTEGLRGVRCGHDVLITTPTASGKSLVFHLPVLEEAVLGLPGKALFLYPLKALGQDQRAKLEALAAAAGLPNDGSLAAIYDGDTPERERARIKRKFPRVVISNPDMLHLGILGSWGSWEPFLKDLKWIVLDELHTYRGIFGSHFHHVLQRLIRLCRANGANPSIVASSATAANADEFARTLAGRGFDWIRESGAPREARHFLLFRPDASPYTLSLQLLQRFLKEGLKTIVFTKARRVTELLYSWLRQQDRMQADRVASYRSGFLPEERRRIEHDLASGVLDGVISTSALEMGVDIGGLDACILVGYPGSVMATWQRSGRVGRGDRESITAMVALPDALDQYFLEHPQEFLGQPFERLIVDPVNEPVSRAHLICAAAEKPLAKASDAPYLEPHAATVGDLLREGHLVEEKAGEELAARVSRPHGNVSLRGGGATSAILDKTGRTIGTVDGVRVLHECHPGAIYLHWGRQFLVRELDLDASKVHAEQVSVDYYTTPLTEKNTAILEVLSERRDDHLQAFLARVRVTERVTGFERRRIFGQEPLDRHELTLPPVSYETVALVWIAPREIEEALRGNEHHFMGALHASEHAAISLMPLLALCDRNDIGGISIPLHPQLRTGAVFIYDGHPGGVGIAERAFNELPELLARVISLLESCDCESGCPSCVQSPKCGNGNRPLDKDGAARFLRYLLGKEAFAVGPSGVSRVEIEPAEAFEESELRTQTEKSRQRRERREARLDQPFELEAPAADRPELDSAPAGLAPSVRSDSRLEVIALPRNPRRTMLFDLETNRSAGEVGGWDNAHKMGVALGAVCHLQEGRIEVFQENEILELITLLDTADAVIGYNILRFDYPVLSGYTGVEYHRKWPTLDLLADLRSRHDVGPKMNALARATLGSEKSADGLKSLEWVKKGRLDLVEEYCRKDVEILRDLYLFGRRMGYVVLAGDDGKERRLEVDW